MPQFSFVHDINRSSEDINYDLSTIKDWAHQRKMNFNPDTAQQTQEVIFTCKIQNQNYPILV